MSKRDYQRGANRPHWGSKVTLRDAADEVEAYHALKHVKSRTAREQEEQRELEKKRSIALPKPKLRRAIKRALEFAVLAQAHGEMLAETWQTNDPRLAERLGEAMKTAYGEGCEFS